HLFSAADGTHLRSLRYKNWSPYASGLRALMINGRLWLPQFEGDERFDFGVTINAYSLTGGQKVKTLKLATPIRQRCRPPLASEAFMFLGGMNTVDLNTGDNGSLPIVRSACHIGLVPANGLLYVPPTHCRCFSMIPGYAALESRGRMGGPLAQANPSDHPQRGPAFGKLAPLPFDLRDTSKDWPSFRRDDMRHAHVSTTVPAGFELLWSSKLSGAPPSSPVADNRVALVSIGPLHRIEAVSLADGSRRWSFVAGGRIDGPPTIIGDSCVFGCRDGWVYALDLSDGELAWRNLAAPQRRRIMVSGQLESAWPALGPVAIANGTVCAVAGRHNMAEGGIVVSGFDMSSGKKEWQRETPHRDLANPLTGGAYEPLSVPFSLTPDPRPSACILGGWLVSDGSAVQIDRLGAFEGGDGQPRALFDGRLDAEYAGNLRPLKNRSPRPDFQQWLLTADDGRLSCRVEKGKLVQVEGGEVLPLPESPPLENVIAVASAGREWVVLTTLDPRQPKTPESRLLVLDKANRRIRAECRFPGRPVSHGLAVSNGRVLIATTDGRLLCFGSNTNTRYEPRPNSL
ncbi:MAG: PQQ-binding-like beta-propeller repeat protein, partial [Planctomycetes bacterium]|nr:PQQ-binding-like beta-propeller repeat protein [Planctomycetota bacterium]